MSNHNSLKNFIIQSFSLLVIGFFFEVHSQVPVENIPNPSDPLPSIQQGAELGDLGLGVLADPVELSLVDGLDEPLERLRLRDQDTNMILDMIQLLTNKYILRPQNLPQVKINFDSFSILTKRETLLVLDSLLAMNGVGISQIDERVYKAVPASGMNVHVPIWLEGPASSINPSQRIYMKMFHLEYAPAVEVREQLIPFSTPNVGALLLFEKANSILATDSLLNLQRMEKLLESIDRPISREELGTEFFIHDTLHAGARELETKLKTMIEGSFKSFLGGTTQVDSDERTGKLIVVTRKENLDTIKFILETLDAPVKMKTTSKLFKLQHAEAKDIQAILDEVIKKQQSIKQKVQGGKNIRPTTSNTKSGAKPPTPGGQSASATVANQSNSSSGEGEGSHEFSDFITISADERSNAILVYGTKADITEIGTMIESLDQPLPLARIDTIFVMVDLTEQNQRGIDALFSNLEWTGVSRGAQGEGLFGEPATGTRQETSAGVDGLLGTSDDVTTNIESNIPRNNLQGVLAIPGLNSAIPFQMEDWELTGIRWDQIFALSSERNDVRIFSTPSLMVSHNAPEVHILIEDERNIVIPTYYGNTSTDGSSSTGNAEKITAKTSLEIKKPKIGLPLIDENGTIISKGSIFMEVEVKAEKFDETQSNTYQGQSLPAKKIREAKSFVTIRDEEIIVLGGLQEVQVDSTESKYNLLSDLPYFGEKFFRPQTIKYTPTELLIFLKPTIMKPGRDNTLKNIQSIDERIDSGYAPKFRSPSGRILGMPNIDGVQQNNSSSPDVQSSKPSF
ncbi:MAG: secretin N-terminal domain-containing protein [Opitutales bacterium]|nr:secretin N-terminal domain-containing protein [Opitutales bacterium]MDG1325475.1 secretin N-terminal domain-containing protein [Opitutales bacterium]